LKATYSVIHRRPAAHRCFGGQESLGQDNLLVWAAFPVIIEESGIATRYLPGCRYEVAMIVFLCARCGHKLQIPDNFAGKPVRCSLCKHVMTSPAPVAVAVAAATVALPQIEGQASSLAQAGLNGSVTVGLGDSGGTKEAEKASASQRSLREALAPGSSGGQRYRVLSEIARGGMGAVLRAADCDIRREVAVKYLLDQADERKKARFVEEAQITGQLEHPNIVPIHELGVDAKGRLFFSMKMVRGRSLQQVLAELRDYPRTAEKEYPLSRLLTVFVNVCHALSYAHSRGVVHRDLKPANVMIGDFGEVYVMDWGLAKVLEPGGSKDAPTAVIQGSANPSFSWVEEPAHGGAIGSVKTSRQAADDQTVDGTILGTPLYMPPEQAVGNVAAIDERSDVYSLGAMLYEILTLQAPIEKEGGHLAILMRVSQGEIKAPALRTPQRARAGKIPKELAAVAMKALAKKPDQRYPSVELMRRDIERFLEGRSVSAKEDTKWEVIWKFVQRNKGLSAATAAATVLLAVIMIWSSVVNYKARVRAEDAYSAYLREQDEKRAQARKSVPAFVEAAHAAAEHKKFNDALAQVHVALDYDPDYAPARLLKGQLLLARKDFAGARQELERYLKARPDDAQTAKLARLCAAAKADDPAVAAEMADVLIRQEMSPLAVGLVQAPDKLRDIHRQKIEKAWPGLGQRLTMDADGRLALNLDNCPQVLDLVPLKGMPLRELIVYHSQIRDLAPLKGMPLTKLDLNDCPRITDLTPLKAMKLTSLGLQNWGDTKDFSAFKGMPLTSLVLHSVHLRNRDLRLLRDAPLTELRLAGAQELTDLTALKGKQIKQLFIDHCPQLNDLSGIEGMPLTTLMLVECRAVADLTPLEGLPLTTLNLDGTPLRDLTRLRGMPLATLSLFGWNTDVDLAPLHALPLTVLNLGACSQIKDLTPLRGTPLAQLRINDCAQITDLTPLEGTKLTYVYFSPMIVKKGVDVLRSMKSLTTINDLPAAEFWKKYDAGEFNK
jgi:serine/threonine protein kinase